MWIFSIQANALWRGTFYYCSLGNIENTKEILEKIITKSDCENFDGEWVNSNDNYDNVFQSMIVIFKIMLGENWVRTMY